MVTNPSGTGDERLRQISEQVMTMAARAREAGDQLNRIATEATSRNRAVTVTVGSGGILKSIRPGPGADRLSAVQLCSAVMDAYGLACRQAAAEASALMEQVTGKDTRAMQIMRESMPVADEEGTQ